MKSSPKRRVKQGPTSCGGCDVHYNMTGLIIMYRHIRVAWLTEHLVNQSIYMLCDVVGGPWFRTLREWTSAMYVSLNT